jgi:Uma2 family endonuclease
MALTEQLTLDEFLLLPEAEPALEYERGAITQKMAPLAWHGILQGELYFRFRVHRIPESGVRPLSETRVTWPSEGISYVPDVIAYRTERLPVNEHGEVPQHLFVPPDAASEIASPGQGFAGQRQRCRWYLNHGVPLSLLFRPEQRAVWTFRPGAEQGPLRDDDMIDLDDVFPGLSFTVAELFSALRG